MQEKIHFYYYKIANASWKEHTPPFRICIADRKRFTGTDAQMEKIKRDFKCLFLGQSCEGKNRRIVITTCVANYLLKEMLPYSTSLTEFYLYDFTHYLEPRRDELALVVEFVPSESIGPSTVAPPPRIMYVLTARFSKDQTQYRLVPISSEM